MVCSSLGRVGVAGECGRFPEAVVTVRCCSGEWRMGGMSWCVARSVQWSRVGKSSLEAHHLPMRMDPEVRGRVWVWCHVPVLLTRARGGDCWLRWGPRAFSDPRFTVQTLFLWGEQTWRTEDWGRTTEDSLLGGCKDGEAGKPGPTALSLGASGRKLCICGRQAAGCDSQTHLLAWTRHGWMAALGPALAENLPRALPSPRSLLPKHYTLGPLGAGPFIPPASSLSPPADITLVCSWWSHVMMGPHSCFSSCITDDVLDSGVMEMQPATVGICCEFVSGETGKSDELVFQLIDPSYAF